MSIKGQMRQGDVLLRRLNTPNEPGDQVPPINGLLLLAESRVSGNTHTVDATCARLWMPATQVIRGIVIRYLEVTQACSVEHQEHGSMALVPSWYEVRNQRRATNADEPRAVED